MSKVINYLKNPGTVIESIKAYKLKLNLKNLKRFIKKYRIIERHKNPWGIFLRIPTYLLLFWALWNNHGIIIIIALFIEVCLWLFIPPSTKTFNFINNIVQNELLWLKAKIDALKGLSIFLFFAAVIAIMTGLWVHNYIIIISGLIALITFNLIMNRIARRESSRKAQTPNNG